MSGWWRAGRCEGCGKVTGHPTVRFCGGEVCLAESTAGDLLEIGKRIEALERAAKAQGQALISFLLRLEKLEERP